MCNTAKLAMLPSQPEPEPALMPSQPKPELAPPPSQPKPEDGQSSIFIFFLLNGMVFIDWVLHASGMNIQYMHHHFPDSVESMLVSDPIINAVKTDKNVNPPHTQTTTNKQKTRAAKKKEEEKWSMTLFWLKCENIYN